MRSNDDASSGHERVFGRPQRKIVAAVRRGMSKAQAAHIFGVGATSFKRYVKMDEKGESLIARKAPGRERKLDEGGMKLLKENLCARPAVTYSQRAEYLYKLLGVRVSESTICRMLKQLGYTRKKICGCYRKR